MMDPGKIRILVVEDEQSHADLIERYLAAYSSTVVVTGAVSLRQGIKEMEVSCPDLVLLDLNLPDGSAIDYLKKTQDRRSYPVLIMTSQGNESLAVAAMKAGALDYIVKSPESFAAIPRIVERSLREWNTLQERHRAEERAERARQEWEATFDAMTDMVTIHDQQMRIVRSNKAARDFAGTDAAELAGKICCDALWNQINICADCPLAQTIKDGEHHSATISLANDTKFFHVTTSPLPPVGEERYFIHVARDITAGKLAELELRKLGLAVEQSPTSVVITDLEGKIEYVNAHFTEVSGYEAAEVLGQNPRMLSSGKDNVVDYQQLWSHLLAGEEWQGEFLNKHKSGRLFWERALISPLRDDQGQITHYVGIKEDITSQKHYERELEYQATHDALTGLANRALLKDRLEQAIHYAQRSKRIVAVALLDLDRFKVINDTLGHASGDELLCQIAERLKQAVRETDTVARFGGDEFMVLLTEVAAARDLRQVMEKILGIFSQPYQIDQR